MEKLPPEIIDHIVKFLPDQTCVGRKDGLASFALVSRQWQQAVERRTFSRLQLLRSELDKDSTAETPSILLEEFAQIFDETTRGTTRASALKRLRYFTQPLPQFYDDWKKCSSIDKKWNACSSSERNAELQYNTELVLSRLKRLYDIIGGWSVKPSIDLDIHVTTRTTYHLVAPEAIPRSQAIKRLRCSGWTICSPALFISIASGLSALQGIALSFYDLYPSINPVERRKKRYDLAKQLSSLASSCSTLRDVELNFQPTNLWDQLTNTPSILLPHSPTDHLSLSIQELVRTCKIKSLTLDGIALTLQLFQSHQTLSDIPWWHTLTRIDITFSSMAADGGWFFDGHPQIPIDLDTKDERNNLGPRRRRVHQMFARQEALARDFDFEQDPCPQHELDLCEQVVLDYSDLGYEPEDEETPFLFRIWPSQMGDALLLDMARAAAQMPELKSFRGGCNMELCAGKRRFEFQYLAPYEKCPELYRTSGFTFDPPLEEYPDDALHINTHRLYWRVASSWRMSEELELCWQQVMGRAGIVEYCEWSMSIDDFDPLWRADDGSEEEEEEEEL